MMILEDHAGIAALDAAAVPDSSASEPDDHNEAERLLREQNAVIERILDGERCEAVLMRLVAALEASLRPAASCMIVWAEDGTGRLLHVASSRLQGAARRAIEIASPSVAAAAGGADGFAPLTEALSTACRADGLAWMTVEPIGSQSEPSGLLVVAGAEAATGRVARQVLRSTLLLARFALETDHRRRALLSANERFAALAETIPGVIYQRVVQPDGDIRYTYISEAARDLFGVSPEEIIANPQALFDCHGPEYYATFHNRLLEASRKLQLWDVEATIITRDGQRKYTHAIARPHRLPSGAVVWNGVILDATRIKEAELAAAATEARTRNAIIESVPHGFALFDPEDRLITWNSRFRDFYPGLADVLFVGASYADLVRSEIRSGIEPVGEGGDAETRFHERMANRRIGSHAFERQLADGRWILVSEHRSPERGTVSLHTDITEIKAREAALERSNRELETFASIASHDLQEPLRKIDAFGGRLARKYRTALGEEGVMYIDRMQSAVDRMRSLINDLLDYSRVTTKGQPFARVPLGDIVGEVLTDLQISIESVGGTVTVGELPVIDADRTQMRQLFQNLIANALKFHRPGVPPLVTIEPVPEADVAAGDAAVRRCGIRVTDNGIGFDMKYAERIFGIFQRLHTRAEYDGTGVGLATCRKIVERHGGTIQAQSVIDEGTAFFIDLPVRQPAAEGN